MASMNDTDGAAYAGNLEQRMADSLDQTSNQHRLPALNFDSSRAAAAVNVMLSAFDDSSMNSEPAIRLMTDELNAFLSDPQVVTSDIANESDDKEIEGHSGNVIRIDEEVTGHSGNVIAIDEEVTGHSGNVIAIVEEVTGHSGNAIVSSPPVDLGAEQAQGVCDHCGIASLFECSDCGLAHYCTLFCQTEHWPLHRAACIIEQRNQNQDNGNQDWIEMLLNGQLDNENDVSI